MGSLGESGQLLGRGGSEERWPGPWRECDRAGRSEPSVQASVPVFGGVSGQSRPSQGLDISHSQEGRGQGDGPSGLWSCSYWVSGSPGAQVEQE